MNRFTLMAAVLGMALLLAACGAQKNDLDIGQGFYKQGDCASALPYLDSTIASPDSLMDLGYAYFIKAKCAEKSGDIPDAYENYYAAKVVACYVVAHDTHVNLNTYGRSEFCERIIPAKLEELAPRAGDVGAIKAKVDGKLHARYLERFATQK
ncbi:hypothetical protein GM415_16485 [Pseudodesulfovibrio cashew]|uniref:Lipoprotein n=1 Tax=Pseudodesulfovibrio cashew TaxID=2678688 RepID=A0A6I6JKX5_9BACT|nr:hypothetical protein [Pseudodesulfovibrio cashew]QGY41650.1 hypothetical protein GM415_16485 [Pseudodesulfovibrio cashew]